MDLYVGDVPVIERLQRVAGEFDFSRLDHKIMEASRAFPSGWPMGFERRLLVRRMPSLAAEKVVFRSRIAQAVRYEDSRQVDHLTARPPSEIAARLLWRSLDARGLRVEDIPQISSLSGAPGTLRSGTAMTTRFKSGHRIMFTHVRDVRERLAILIHGLNVGKPDLPPLLDATRVMFETLVLHPLTDGNGRLARLMFQGALRLSLGLKVPILPLGPVFAANRCHLQDAYLAWCFDHDPRPMIRLVSLAVDVLTDIRFGSVINRSSPGRIEQV